jgi:hypothetical protein
VCNAIGGDVVSLILFVYRLGTNPSDAELLEENPQRGSVTNWRDETFILSSQQFNGLTNRLLKVHPLTAMTWLLITPSIDLLGIE